jgi:ribosomal subunit interface protein
MQTTVTFRHIKARQDLHEAAIEQATKFNRFYDGIISTNIEFIHDVDNVVEFKVNVQGNTFISKENTEDFTKSLNIASDKMVRQLKKWKTKITKPVS